MIEKGVLGFFFSAVDERGFGPSSSLLGNQSLERRERGSLRIGLRRREFLLVSPSFFPLLNELLYFMHDSHGFL